MLRLISTFLRHANRALTLAAPFLVVIALAASESKDSDYLELGFKHPPDEARPRTWWHWTGGNITREGITKDLEWMHRAGLAGFQLADVSFGRGQDVEPKIDFASPEWFDAVRHAATEAERLGLEMSIFSSAGWSLTGGPWVQPNQAMKKLVWSETVVEGPVAFHAALPLPPSGNGPIRDLGPSGGDDPTYYGDTAVIAFPLPAAESDAMDPPIVSTPKGVIDGAALLDDSLKSTATISTPADGGPAWVQFEYAQPFTARAITISANGGIPVGRVTASEDGTTFYPLVVLPGAQLYRQGQVRTFAFPATTAKFFRVEMTHAALGPAQTMSQAATAPAAEYELREARFHSGARVHRWEEKAGFSFLFEYESVPTPSVSPALAIPHENVVDLTSRLGRDGVLDWEAPAGRWAICRLGYSLTGAKNRPATAAGLGYEVDKLSRQHVEAYYEGYAGPLARALGPKYRTALSHMLLDSWEAGMQNWTEDMLSEFTTRRGYDPTPFLPALTGFVVDSADVSDRFLWDFRRTLADMFADNFYQTMDDLLDRDGLSTYSEASGVSLEIPEDTLLVKSKIDIPMGEFWFRDLHPRLMYYQDVRGAASAAHIYGKKIVATESFTGGGYQSPYDLKRVGDYWLAQGLNRIVFHTSAHQPLDTKPGNTMVGTHLNRNITWAGQAKPFMDYLARNCYLLQQGLFVADLAYLLGEGAPSTMPIWGAGLTPSPPADYDYDYLNVDALLRRVSIAPDGRLVLPDGMSYRVLVLPEIDQLRPEVVQKLHELVQQGATIVGPRPTHSPSLADFPAADVRVQTLATDLWGDLDGRSRTIHRFGLGQVVWGLPLEDVLAMMDVPPDFEYEAGLDSEVAWIHRRTQEADFYYVANLTDQPRHFDARFRVSGREAEVWHPVTGTIEPSGFSQRDGRTTVPLRLTERDAVFIVFRRSTATPIRTVPVPVTNPVATLTGPWNITFQPGLGAPAAIRIPELASWTDQPDRGVKYFSGTATYHQVIEAPADWFQTNAQLLLDLGQVADLAEVSINGTDLGELWCAPFQVDVSDVLQPGSNKIEIKVTNEWTNRLIGDAALPLEEKILQAGGVRPGGFRSGTPEPSPAGLLGPVQILSLSTP